MKTLRLHLASIDPAERAALLACGQLAGAVLHVREDCYRQVIASRIASRPAARAQQPARQVKANGGVGTEVKKLLASAGIFAGRNCSCEATAAQWDANGIAWCQAHVNQMAAYLNSQAIARGWAMGLLAKLTSVGIIRTAIARAITQAQQTQQKPRAETPPPPPAS